LNGIAIFRSSISSSSLDFGCIIFDPTLLFKAGGYTKYKICKYIDINKPTDVFFKPTAKKRNQA
jgi:hypothetical protein